MFGWFKVKRRATPTPPPLLHRWSVDVCRWWEVKGEDQTEVFSFEVSRSTWQPDDRWGQEWTSPDVMGRFDTEQEARDFIDKHAHLPQAFDITKSYETTA
jgi:hypothetical protein